MPLSGWDLLGSSVIFVIVRCQNYCLPTKRKPEKRHRTTGTANSTTARATRNRALDWPQRGEGSTRNSQHGRYPVSEIVNCKRPFCKTPWHSHRHLGVLDLSGDTHQQSENATSLHLIASIFLFVFDACHLLFPTKQGSCGESEQVMARLLAICLLYVAVLYSILTYHNKRFDDMITRLSNFALHSAVALLCSVIYAGNVNHGGLERGWMHWGDMLTMLLLVGILLARVSEDGVLWANKTSSGVLGGMGVNCKTLLLLFLVVTFLKVFALTEIEPEGLVLAEGVSMTKLATYMWNFVAVTVLEIAFALVFALLYDDGTCHELMVLAIAFMTLVAIGSLYPETKHMGGWYDFSSNTIWIKLGIVLGICATAVVGGRLTGAGGGRRGGYTGVGEGASLNV